jgi:hypothetical protein
MNSDNSKALGLGLLLVLLFLRIKKGIGTTLFGIGTQIDLNKPIENLEDFRNASDEMQSAGWQGTIKPKGIYYQLNDGETIRIARNIIYDDGTKTDSTFETVSYPARKIFGFQMQYEGALPPLLYWEERIPLLEVRPNGQSRSGTQISIATPINGLNWSKFKKQ